MKPAKHHIPEGYHSITPYLIVDGAAKAIDFYKTAFGAVEIFRLPGPDGKIGHAELKIGDSIFMMADEHPNMEAYGPRHHKGTPVGLMLYVKDVDATVKKALGAGAEIKQPVKDQFYGDRSGTVVDPFGHKWTVATHKEDLTMEEIEERMKKLKG